MAEHHLTVARPARYQQLGEPSAHTRRVWLVCHGYGQLAEYFIRHFAFLTETTPPPWWWPPKACPAFT